MAISTINITGKVVEARATYLRTIMFQPGTVSDAGTIQVIDGEQTITIASDGTVDFNLVPMDNVTPSNPGNYYVVIYGRPGKIIRRETWEILSTGANPLEIGNVTIL